MSFWIGLRISTETQSTTPSVKNSQTSRDIYLTRWYSISLNRHKCKNRISKIPEHASLWLINSVCDREFRYKWLLYILPPNTCITYQDDKPEIQKLYQFSCNCYVSGNWIYSFDEEIGFYAQRQTNKETEGICHKGQSYVLIAVWAIVKVWGMTVYVTRDVLWMC